MKTSPSQRCLTGCLLVFTLLYPFWMSAQQESPIQQGVKTADSVKYYVSSGQKLAAERKFEEALIAYEKARKFDNKNEEAILGQMEVNFQLRRVNEGLKIIEEWTKIDPENVNAWKNMAGFFSMTGQDEVALNALDRLIQLQPDSASNWISKARLLLGRGDNKEAAEACDKAIALDSKASEARYIKAYALAGMEKYDEAIAECNEAIKHFPDATEAYYTRACIYSRKGDKDKALSDLGKTIEMDPAIKERAGQDPDFKTLYSDKKFQDLTGVTKADAEEAALEETVCNIADQPFKRVDYLMKIKGYWRADRAYVHGENLLGDRNFYFRFNPDGTIEIKEPNNNWSVTGTWKIGENENSLVWVMPDKNTSFNGKYDFLGKDLILSGQGFIGEFEHVCLRLKIEKQ